MRSWTTNLLGALVVLIVVTTSCSVDETGSPSTAVVPQSESTVIDHDTSSEPAGSTHIVEPSPGCEQTATSRTQLPTDDITEVNTLQSSGDDREYLIDLPRLSDGALPSPLIVNLHGHGGSAAVANQVSQLPNQATERGYIVVAPSARDGVWEYGATGDDATFLTDLIEHVTVEFCVDLGRIHFVGMSLGAWKSAVTACHSLAGSIASLALVTVEAFPGECESMSVVAFHGTADTVVAYGEGGGTVDASATPNAAMPGTLTNMSAWANNANCAPEPEKLTIAHDVEHLHYMNCRDDTRVELYTIIDGHHVWPGSDLAQYGNIPVTHSINATEIIINFFDAHQ